MNKLFKVKLVFVALIVFANCGYAQDLSAYVKTVKKSVIRVDSTTGGEIIAEVPQGTPLEKISEAYDWYKVRLPRSTHAYVFAKYISAESKCIATKLNVRHKPDPASNVLGSIAKDEKVVILDTVGKWYKIRAYPFAYGWIHSNRVESTTVKPMLIEDDNSQDQIIVSKPKPVKKATSVINTKVVTTEPVAPKVVKPDVIKPNVIKPKAVPPKIVKEEKAEIKVTDLDAIINKHKKLKKKISKQVVETTQVHKKESSSMAAQLKTDVAPYSGQLKKARRTATPAKFKIVHDDGYTLLHIPNPTAVKKLINKAVYIWGEKVEDGDYTYVVVKRIKKVN